MIGLLLSSIGAEARLYGFARPSYENFIGFVKEYIAPHMGSRFVEEAYYRTFWDARWLHRFTDIQISRGHSKSELVIWRAIYLGVFQPSNPHFRAEKGYDKPLMEFLISSSDGTTTGELADRLKYYFRADETLSQLLPSGGDEELPDNTRKLSLRNGTTFFFRSLKMKRGLHPDDISIDDPTTESPTLTDQQSWDFFTGAILPMSTANVAMVGIDGTPLRSTDILSRIRRMGEHEVVGEEGGVPASLWYHVHLPAFDRKTGVLLSPGRFSKQMLDDVKAMQGSRKFEAEYLLNPIDDESSIIKREWLESCIDHSASFVFNRANFDNIYLGWDFAFSDRITADHAVGVVLGKQAGKLFVLNIHTYKGLSGLEQLEKVKELHIRYKFDMIGLEENSITAIQKEVQNIRMPNGGTLPVRLFRLGAHDDQANPLLKGNQVINVGKQPFIVRLAVLFENREIVLPYKGIAEKALVDQLISEATSWSLETRKAGGGSTVGFESKLVEIGPHPDIPVALGYAVEVSRITGGFVLF